MVRSLGTKSVTDAEDFRTPNGGTILQTLQAAANATKAALVPDTDDGTTTILEVA